MTEKCGRLPNQVVDRPTAEKPEQIAALVELKLGRFHFGGGGLEIDALPTRP